MLDDALKGALLQRKQDQRYRQRMLVSSPQGSRISVDGRSYLGFLSNDYLGLANHPEVIDSFQSTASSMGVGSGASHLVNGHSEHHHRLEIALADFTGRERALMMSTGYMANLGVVTALSGRGDTIIEDRLNHASLIDAGLLSRASVKRFRHNDCAQLEQILMTATGRKLIAVDGVFSMDGDLAPLPDIVDLCRRYQGHLMIDDAHGFGVLGANGGGCAEHFDLSQAELPILVGTLGKSFGTFGAFVAGSETLIETLIQFARPYIYTTALPPAIAAASLRALTLIQTESWRRESLEDRIRQFRSGAQDLGLPLMDSSTPIQPLVLGGDDLVMSVAEQLKEEGILVGAIRPPTVPEGTGRLRITFSATHSEDDVDLILRALDRAIPQNIRQDK